VSISFRSLIPKPDKLTCWPRALALFLLILCAQTPVFAARSVALVYDDSGSMRNHSNWRYANYALQGLVAFLGDEDVFNLVLMSNPGEVNSYRGSQIRHQLIDKLQKTVEPSGDTPYQAIQTARDSLKNVSDSDDKWLIIITDGKFIDSNQLDQSEINNLRQKIEKDSNEFVQLTGAQTVLLVIGKESDRILIEVLEKTSQATILQAEDSKAIIDRLHETAAMLTSHNAKSNDLHPLEMGRVLQISPLFPLSRLTVFLQSKDKKTSPPEIKSITIQNGVGTSDPYRLSLIADSRKGDKSLSAIVHIRPVSPTTLIHEGKDQLTISFDKDIKDFVYKLYPDVAAKLDIQLKDHSDHVLTMHSGQPIDVCEDTLLSIHAKLISNSGKTLTEASSDISQFGVNYFFDDGFVNAMQINPAKTEFSGQFKPKQGTSTISVKAAYPGYFDLRSQIFTLRTVDCKPRVFSIFSDSSNWNESLLELPSSKIILSATVDGKPLLDSDFANVEMSIVSDTALEFSLHKDQKNKNWQLLPRFNWGCACFTPAGDQKVKIQLTGTRVNEQSQQDLILKVNDVPWWDKCGRLFITAIIIVLLLWYLFGIIKKPRFGSGSVVKFTRGHRTLTESLPSSWASRWLIPYIPEKRYIGSVLFIAAVRSSYILLSSKNQTEDMTINGLPIDNPGVRDVRLSNMETLLINARPAESYTYSTQ
jgi:hypothetical protein